MRAWTWQTVLDRILLAGAVVTGGLLANHVAPQLPLPKCANVQHQNPSDLQCSTMAPRALKRQQLDAFVPTAPNEPMESLEN